MDDITIQQMKDVSYSTLADIRKREPPLVYAYANYRWWNTFIKSALRSAGGDELEGHITLGTEGNAKHTGFWTADSLVVKNIEEKYTLPWRRATGGMAWNIMEMSLNKGPARIYDVWKQKYRSAIRDIVEDMQLAMLTGPSSASDTTNPYSVTSWLPWGTAGTLGWTGYSGHYNDGGGAAAATFNRGGLASAAGTNPGWASWSGDHAGNIDDSLLSILNDAQLDLNFEAPMVPEKLPGQTFSYAQYTTKNVIKKLNTFYAKSDDNMGYHPGAHYNEPVLNGVPLVYVPVLDTARTSVYGTDPIIGINHNLLYPVIHNDWNFTIVKDKDADRHLVVNMWVDTLYQVFCESPRYAGFLCCQIPT